MFYVRTSTVFATAFIPAMLCMGWPFKSNGHNLLYINHDIPGTNCTIDGDIQCICLPDTPPVIDPPLDLIELLTRGSDFLKNYTSVKDAVLFLGNTGAGKTTATQIVAGNLSRLHAVVAYGDTMVIIDEEDRIGLPSLKSKTLFPEMIVKPADEYYAALPFYDFPGFDDTRGPVQDIAANFFMTEVVKKVENLKLLFVAVQSSVTGDTRDGFDSLAQHAVEFVKRIDLFRDSIGLVVTKVRSFNNFGRYISDETVIQGVASFLQSYNQTLYESLESDKSRRNETLKKIIFVETLLETDSNQKYSRIWLIRSPLDCGRLSEQEIFLDSKTNITALYRKLHFTPIGNVDENFGFTLKDSTKINIANYSNAINQGIAAAVKQVTEETSLLYLKNISASISNLGTLSERLWKNKIAFDNLINEIEDMASGATDNNPDKFASLMKIFFQEIEYPLRKTFLEFMEWQAIYLDFFDKAAGELQRRDVHIWTIPLKRFHDEFAKYPEWYQFCFSLQTRLYSANFHLNKPVAPEDPDNTKWLEYVNEQIETVSPRIFEVAALLDSQHLDVLKSLIIFSLHPVKHFCISSPNNAVVMHGNFLHMEKVFPNITLLAQECGNAKELLILSGHTVFLTYSIALDGYSLGMLTPNLVASQASNIEIVLDGKPGLAHSPSTAARGSDGTSSRQPTAGTHGCAGKAGGPAGNAFIAVGFLESTENVVVSTNGGNGGPGQHGGNGGIGFSPGDARCMRQATTSCESQDFDKPDLCRRDTIANNIHCYHYGLSGQNGAAGGNGGEGGTGGWAGNNTVLQFFGTNKILKTSQFGQKGLAGNAGNGGSGGRVGKGYFNVASDSCVKQDPSNGRGAGSNGRNGTTGSSQSCLENPKAPDTVLPYWVLILEYRKLFYNYRITETVEFLNYIDRDVGASTIFSLKGLAEELLALENLNSTTGDNERLIHMYLSLAFRLQRFHTAEYEGLTNEHKKVLTMLLASTLASLQSIRKEGGLNFIIDASSYMNGVARQIRTLSAITDRNDLKTTVDEEKDRYLVALSYKLDEDALYTGDVVQFALVQAGNDMVTKVAQLEEQLDDLINDTNLTIEDAKSKLRASEKDQRRHKLLEIFNALASLARNPPAEKLMDRLIEKLTEKYIDSIDKLERLNQFVEELKDLDAEVIEKLEEFDENSVPFLNGLFEYFIEISGNITNGQDITVPELLTTRYQVLQKIRDAKDYLAAFSDESANSQLLVSAISRVQDALTLSIDLYESVDQFQDVQNFATYISTMQSSLLQPINITDPDFINIFQNFDNRIMENLLSQEVDKASHAFRQWIFPFAKFYPITPSKSSHTIAPGESELLQVEYLQTELERYKSMVIGDCDRCIFQTTFSSGLVTSKPFYVWENEVYSEDIRRFVSGEIVHFYADVTKQQKANWESIKFKMIEVNMKLNGAPEGFQEEFLEIQDYFGVLLTHSGISHYRFGDKYYVMKGSNQTIMYNFERDVYGNRLGTNTVYEKFKTGEYQLSPYTVWSVQLRYVAPIGKGQSLRTNVGFDDLKKFISYIDLELVGTGTYVDGEKALAAASGDMMLEKYYHAEIF